MENLHEIHNLVLRRHKKADENLILNSWLRSARNHPEFSPMSNELYYKEYALRIQNYLENAECYVLCEFTDPDHIYGYIVFDSEKKLIHFIYIKFPFRKFGFAKKLLELVAPDYEATFFSKRNKHVFNPFKRGF
ncbi:MAG: hypothetical protein KDB74_01540 [Flavobacteriales bacterium]|nr:hypothetical protein [Flavobacteriales bacterium]